MERRNGFERHAGMEVPYDCIERHGGMKRHDGIEGHDGTEIHDGVERRS